jgi:hypothetical protein
MLGLKDIGKHVGPDGKDITSSIRWEACLLSKFKD